ncbi:MAG: hypothetical protein AB2A00_12570 [Myxococcota bacterium]
MLLVSLLWASLAAAPGTSCEPWDEARSVAETWRARVEAVMLRERGRLPAEERKDRLEEPAEEDPQRVRRRENVRAVMELAAVGVPWTTVVVLSTMVSAATCGTACSSGGRAMLLPSEVTALELWAFWLASLASFVVLPISVALVPLCAPVVSLPLSLVVSRKPLATVLAWVAAVSMAGLLVVPAAALAASLYVAAFVFYFILWIPRSLRASTSGLASAPVTATEKHTAMAIGLFMGSLVLGLGILQWGVPVGLHAVTRLSAEQLGRKAEQPLGPEDELELARPR